MPTSQRATPQYVNFMITAIAVAMTVLLTSAAFWLSYEHLHDVAAAHQLTGVRAWAWPATLDAFIIIGEVLILRASLMRGTDPWAIFLTIAGSLGSIILNVTGVGEDGDVLDYVVAGVPPVAALLAFGILMRQIHQTLKEKIYEPVVTPGDRTVPPGELVFDDREIMVSHSRQNGKRSFQRRIAEAMGLPVHLVAPEDNGSAVPWTGAASDPESLISLADEVSEPGPDAMTYQAGDEDGMDADLDSLRRPVSTVDGQPVVYPTAQDAQDMINRGVWDNGGFTVPADIRTDVPDTWRQRLADHVTGMDDYRPDGFDLSGAVSGVQDVPDTGTLRDLLNDLPDETLEVSGHFPPDTWRPGLVRDTGDSSYVPDSWIMGHGRDTDDAPDAQTAASVSREMSRDNVPDTRDNGPSDPRSVPSDVPPDVPSRTRRTAKGGTSIAAVVRDMLDEDGTRTNEDLRAAFPDKNPESVRKAIARIRKERGEN